MAAKADAEGMLQLQLEGQPLLGLPSQGGALGRPAREQDPLVVTRAPMVTSLGRIPRKGVLTTLASEPKQSIQCSSEIDKSLLILIRRLIAKGGLLNEGERL